MNTDYTRSYSSKQEEPPYFILYIPANLELESLLRQYGKSKLFHSYAYVCHAILRGYLRMVKLSDADDFQNCTKYVSLDSRILRRMLTRKKATEIIDNLIAWGVIERKNRYQVTTANVTGSCKGYRLKEEYRYHSIRGIQLRNRPMWKRLAQLQDKEQENQDAHLKQCGTLRFLEMQLSLLRLDFNAAFRQLLQEEENSMHAKELRAMEWPLLREYSLPEGMSPQAMSIMPHTLLPLFLTLPILSSSSPYTPLLSSYVVSFSSFMRLVRLCSFYSASTGERKWEFKLDRKTGRLFTNLTNLYRMHRNHLYLESNERLAIVDVGECQPFMFSTLLKERARSIWGENLPEDVKYYCQLTSSRNFYRYMMDRCGVAPDERDAFKKTIFGSIFYCPKWMVELPDNKPGSIFIEDFPNVYRILCEYKGSGSQNELPIRLMKLESEIILHDVCAEIARSGDENFFIATIHDGIVTTIDRSEQVKRMMENAFWRKFGNIPTLKVEPFNYAEESLQRA